MSSDSSPSSLLPSPGWTEMTLAERVQSYLGNGGLFNPEMMEHDKVRQLIMDLDAVRAAESRQQGPDLKRYSVGAVEHHSVDAVYASTEVEEHPEGNWMKADDVLALLAVESRQTRLLRIDRDSWERQAQTERDTANRLTATIAALHAQHADEIARMRKAMRPITHYVAQREAKPIPGLGDSVHSIHSGTEWDAELLFSDLQRAVAALKGPD